jgi:hypothetical protein
MPPNHPLIEIKPDLDSRYRHDSQPSDELPDPQSPWTRSHPLTHYEPPASDLRGLTAVRPATPKPTPRTRLAADYPNDHVEGG